MSSIKASSSGCYTAVGYRTATLHNCYCCFCCITWNTTILKWKITVDHVLVAAIEAYEQDAFQVESRANAALGGGNNSDVYSDGQKLTFKS